MKVFYEQLNDPIEQSYINISTEKKKVYLNDIIKDTNDIYIQYKNKTDKAISYNYSNIDILSLVKTQHKYFIKNHLSNNTMGYLDVNEDFTIKIIITNNHPDTTTPYKADVYVNNTKVETLKYDDLYTINNYKTIRILSSKLHCYVEFTLPLHINNGEYVEYNLYEITINNEIMHKFACYYNSDMRELTFDRDYKDSLNILVQSYGSILRSSVINELYRLNANSFVLFDDIHDRLILPINNIIKDGDKLRYILSQEIVINPAQLEAGYVLVGIYIDNNNSLLYETIMNSFSYGDLVSNINNFMLDMEKKSRQYIGYIIGLNNISDFVPIDLFLYNVGFGGGGGGTGNANKITIEYQDVEEIEINYAAGSLVAPVVQVLAHVDGGSFEVIQPEQIDYNLNDKINIKLGAILTGKVEII